MPRLATSEGVVAYEERGAGPPLVLLHANGHDRRDFDELAEAMAQRYRTIALDWPGSGESPAPQPPGGASALRFARLLEAAVAALGLERAVFLGHSVGGFAAARLALTQPQRVRALVLVAPGGFSAHTWLTRRFCQLKGSEAVTRSAEALFARLYLRRRTPAVAAMLARIAERQRAPASVAVNAAVWRSFTDPEHDLRAGAAQIAAPTLTILGRLDPVIAPRLVEPALRRIPRGQLVVMDTGHAPFAEDLPAFLGVALPFLTGAADGTPDS